MKKIITLIIIVMILIGGYFYYRNRNPEIIIDDIPNRTEPIACTADAKMCPDGSYVGREGPSCEFKLCPDGTDID